METLDEKGFVFLDSVGRPYHVRMWETQPWLFYWHPDNKWVSLRSITQADVWKFHERALPEEQAQIYHDINDGGRQ